jgi:hypothetical protein
MMKNMDQTSGSELIRYPIDLMRSVASQILTDADNALAQLDLDWKKTQWYIDTLPSILQGSFYDLLDKHQKRLRDAYQWQKDFANALSRTADIAEANNDHIAHGFQSSLQQHLPQHVSRKEQWLGWTQ